MEKSSLVDFIQHFETERVIAFLREANVSELIHNPWFLGVTAALALLALLMKWRVLLATIVSVTGFVGLIVITSYSIHYTKLYDHSYITVCFKTSRSRKC